MLLEKLEKHNCLFRRLSRMGPSNLSLGILKRCTLPRHDYHLRVHKPGASLLLAQEFDKEIRRVLVKWCDADEDALTLASLPCKMGGLGITSTILKHRYLFDASRQSIDEQFKPHEAPVEKLEKQRKGMRTTGSQCARTAMKKMANSEHEKLAAELKSNPRFSGVIKRSKEANYHLLSTNNYVNPYLFQQTLKMRLAIGLPNASSAISCPGCGISESPIGIIPHVAGCSKCAGMNCTRKHSHIVRYLSNLCGKAGLPCAVEPRLYSSFFCTKCKCSISHQKQQRGTHAELVVYDLAQIWR